MAISYKEIRHERQWKASTGLTEEQFLQLAQLFGQAYEKLFGVSMEERPGGGIERVSVQHLPPGIYYWQATTSRSRVASGKLIIQR